MREYILREIFERDEGTPILDGFTYWIPNPLGFNCVFSKFGISRINVKVKDLSDIIAMNIELSPLSLA